MTAYHPLRCAPVVPGADSGTYVLFNSMTSKQVGPNAYRQVGLDAIMRSPYLRSYCRYVLGLRNSKPGTLIAEYSDDKGATWTRYAQQAVVESIAPDINKVGVSIAGFDAVRIRWVNGGAAQATWLVTQWLDDVPTIGFYVDSSGTPNAQLPF